MKKILFVMASAFFVNSLSAQMSEKTVEVGGAPMYPSKNIVANAVNSADHTTLVAAVKAAGLVETLQSSGPFTVFAPTNEYVQSNMKAIVAFEIEVSSLDHVFKWSQNKPLETQEAILQSLQQGNLQEQLAAEEMRMRLKKK